MNEIEAFALPQLAEIFALTEKPDVAREHASASLAIAERKGDVALAARVRKQLAAVGVVVP
jgi:hypothetical protein